MSAANKWVKGVSANPGGRPRIPDELRDIQSYSTEEVKRLISKTGRYTNEEARVSLANACTSLFEQSLIKCWQIAAEKGDPGRIELLLNRSAGKPPQAEEGDGKNPEPLTDEQKALALALLKSVNGAA